MDFGLCSAVPDAVVAMPVVYKGVGFSVCVIYVLDDQHIACEAGTCFAFVGDLAHSDTGVMMLNPIKKCLLLAGVVGLSLSASAGILVQETFDYPNGIFNGRSGGTGFTTNWSNFSQPGTPALIIDDGRVLTSSTPGWASATRKFNPIDYSAGGEFYFSYSVEVTNLSLPASSSALDALNFMADGKVIFDSGLYFQSNGYIMRSEVVGSGNPISNVGTRYTTAGHDLFIVGKFSYDEGSKLATLSYWINPDEAGAQPLYSTSWTIETPVAFDAIRIQRYDGNNINTSTVAFGDIKIGTDWASVVPAIPEPSHAVALIGVLAIVAAGVIRRRRR